MSVCEYWVWIPNMFYVLIQLYSTADKATISNNITMRMKGNC